MAFLDPETALEAALNQRFDLVIVDHIMPKVDGSPSFAGCGGRTAMGKSHGHADGDDRRRGSARRPRSGRHGFPEQVAEPGGAQSQAAQPDQTLDALRKLDDHVAEQAREIEKATQALLAREERWCFACRRRLNTATTTPTITRSGWRNTAA